MSPPSSPRPARSIRLGRFYELLIALRILRARRRAFLSVVSVISMLGIVLGVTALTVILSVSGGFQQAIRDKILGFYPHLVVLKRAGDFSNYRTLADSIRTVPEVRGVSPCTYDEMMVAHGERRAGVVVKGIDLATVRDVSEIERFLEEDTSLAGLDETPDVARPEAARATVGALVAGTAATVLLLPDGVVAAISDDPTEPDVGAARLRLLHAVPNAGELRITLDGPTPEDTAPTAPAAATPYVEAERGTRTLSLRPASGGEPLVEVEADLAEGVSYTALAWRTPAGAAELRVLPDAYVTVSPEEAQVRLVHADASAPAAVLAPSGAPLPAIPPGVATPYVARAGELPGMLLAADLAERLEAKRGDVLTVVTPLRGLGNKMLAPYGMAPTSARFRVVGRFRVGYYEYDNRFVIVGFPAARRFLNRGDVARWLEVRVDDFYLIKERARLVKGAVDPYDIGTFLEHVATTAADIRQVTAGEVAGFELTPPVDVLDTLGNYAQVLGLLKFRDLNFGYRERYKLIDWEEMNRYLFSSLKLQKVVLSIFFLIIILVASFNIIGSQIMIVHEKLRAIAILRSMGAPRKGIRRIFLLQGMVVGTLGTVLGLLLGWAACETIRWVGFGLDPKVYYISMLPVDIDPLEFAGTGAAALLFSFLASRYSANKAAQRTPVEGLRRLD